MGLLVVNHAVDDYNTHHAWVDLSCILITTGIIIQDIISPLMKQSNQSSSFYNKLGIVIKEQAVMKQATAHFSTQGEYLPKYSHTSTCTTINYMK